MNNAAGPGLRRLSYSCSSNLHPVVQKSRNPDTVRHVTEGLVPMEEKSPAVPGNSQIVENYYLPRKPFRRMSAQSANLHPISISYAPHFRVGRSESLYNMDDAPRTSGETELCLLATFP